MSILSQCGATSNKHVKKVPSSRTINVFIAHLVTSITKKKITVSFAHCHNTKIRVVRHLARLALMVGLQGDKEQMHWRDVS
jgi:hypothetical protein